MTAPPEGVPADRRSFREGRKVQSPQKPGRRGQTRQTASREPLPPGEEGEGRGNRGDRPLSSKRSPQSATPIRRPSPNLGSSCEPRTPLGSAAASELPRDSTLGPQEQSGSSPFLPGSHKAPGNRLGMPRGCPRPAPSQRPQRRRPVLGLARLRIRPESLQLQRRVEGPSARCTLGQGPPCAPPAARVVQLAGDGAALSLDLEAPTLAGFPGDLSSQCPGKAVPGKGLGMFLSPWHAASVREVMRPCFATLNAPSPSAPRTSFPSGENNHELAFQRCWRLSHERISLFYLLNF